MTACRRLVRFHSILNPEPRTLSHDQTKTSGSSGEYPINVAKTIRGRSPETPGTSWISWVLKKYRSPGSRLTETCGIACVAAYSPKHSCCKATLTAGDHRQR